MTADNINTNITNNNSDVHDHDDDDDDNICNNRNDIDGYHCSSGKYERSCSSLNVRCASSTARLCLDVWANALPTHSIVKSMLI